MRSLAPRPRPQVSAVLVVRDGARWLPETLDAVAAQTAPISRLVIVDCASSDASGQIAAEHSGVRRAIGEVLTTRVTTRSYAAAVTAGLALLGAGADGHAAAEPAPATEATAAGPAPTTAADPVEPDGDAPPATLVPVPVPVPAPAPAAEPPDPVAPEPVTPDLPVSEPVAPEPVTPESVTPEPVAGDVAQADVAEWIWLLHDDGAPDPDALAHLVDAVRRSPSVGVAGPKIVRWEDPRVFVEVGVQLTRAGRRVALPRPGEIDQGQYDGRTDVLAVPTNGMLVDRQVFDSLRGFDDRFGPWGIDVDFGWRAQLAGHRVVVVPRARVREASATATGARRGAPSAGRNERARRRAARQVALARCSVLAAPVLGVWVGLSGLFAALALLVLKRPRHAAAELADVAALFHPWAILRSRFTRRRPRRVAPADLHGLFVSPRVALRHTWELVRDMLSPSWTLERRAPGRVQPAPSGTATAGPLTEDPQDLAAARLTHRTIGHAGFLVVVAAAAGAGLVWRGMLSAFSPNGHGLAGGQLRSVLTDSQGLWHLATDGWHGAGLGGDGPAQLSNAVLAGWTWLVEQVPAVGSSSPASVALAWLFLAAMPLAALSAFLSGRVITRARWPRAFGALVWVSAGPLVAALTTGRLSAVVAHVLLPVVAAGFARVARRDASATATFATAVAVALLGVFVPAFLGVGLAAALVLLVVGPDAGRRVRALALLVVPVALLGPAALRYWQDPVSLLGGPGLVTAAGGVQSTLLPWQIALGQLTPSRGVSGFVLGPVLLLAVAGIVWPARGSARGASLAALGLLSVVGLSGALLAERLVLGPLVAADGTTAPAVLWVGVGEQLYLLAVTALAVIALTRWTVPRPAATWSAVVAVGAGLVAVAAPSALAGYRAWTTPPSLAAVSAPDMPAVAADEASGPDAARMLVIDVTGTTATYRVLSGEPSEPQRDVNLSDPAPDPVLAGLVTTLVNPGTSADNLSGALYADGVGFVSVSGDASGAIARRLDEAGGLARLGGAPSVVLWRVAAQTPAGGGKTPLPAARVQLRTAAGALLGTVPTDGPDASVAADLPAGSGPRVLHVAEPVGWADRATVTYDGTVLAATVVGDRPTYRLPAAAGHLTIVVPPQHPRWDAVQGVLLLVVLYLALPFGSHRSRRRLWS